MVVLSVDVLLGCVLGGIIEVFVGVVSVRFEWGDGCYV